MASAEDHVPEKGHLLLELAGVVDHAEQPLLDVGLNGGRMVIGWVAAIHEIFFKGRLRFRIE
jgi:hypothetical protein